MVKMSATEARDKIGKLWEIAAKEPVTVESAGKPIAVVLSPEAYDRLANRRHPRHAGCGRHLLSGAGINVNELLATSVEDTFSDYMPDR